MKKSLMLFPMLLALIVIVFCAAASVGAAGGENGSAYLLGDADGDGRVNINDVTLVQRVVAELEADEDGSIARRASITGGELSVDDATLLQRFLAEFESDYEIGESVTEPCTEPPTEAPATEGSTAPSVPSYTPGPNELPFVPN